MEIRYYRTPEGNYPFQKWLRAQPREARARIYARLGRVRNGNLGVTETVGENVHELKIYYGPGYRIYFAYENEQLILLLCASDKDDQKAGIKLAKYYWADHRRNNNG